MDTPAHSGHSIGSGAATSDRFPDGPANFFVADGDSTAGPYTAAELRARLANGALTPENYVCLPGWGAWKRIGDVSELSGWDSALVANSAPPTVPSTTASDAVQNTNLGTGFAQPPILHLFLPHASASPITPKNPLLAAWSAVGSIAASGLARVRLPRWVELSILIIAGAALVFTGIFHVVRLKDSLTLKRAREATETNAKLAGIARARADAERIAREQAERQAWNARIRADAEAKVATELNAIAEVRARAKEGDRNAQVQLAKLLDGLASANAWLTCGSNCLHWPAAGGDPGRQYYFHLAALNERATNVSANTANSFFRGKHWHDHPLPSEALDMYRKAAEQGSAEAQVALGDAFGPFTELNHSVHSISVVRPFYEDGGPIYGFSFAKQQRACADLAGVPSNKSEAFKWYYRAAQQGDPYAQGQVAAAYLDGKGGVMRSEMEACKWDILSGDLSAQEMAGFWTLNLAQKAAVSSWVRSFKPTGPDVELVAINRAKVFAERHARKQAEEQKERSNLARMDREYADREREKLYALNKFTSSISAAAQDGSLAEMAKNPSWRRFRADEIRAFNPSVANDPAKVEQQLEKIIREASR